MNIIPKNCSKCPDYLNSKCKGDANNCICRRCPRNLGECLIVRYCRETESVLEYGKE
ncbi:hypothetical protein ACER0A_000395 [Haloimpatiens sp. FM7315]|uniref:hypothetical protein n=1 Tax=Haloimpatiens sp. FM7315 TaxID=3298609 RepID=UPI0035A2E19A